MNEVFFIADDFGLSPEINAAIVHAHVHGVLDGAALMLGQPGTADALRLAREHPTLLVGWHLHLNDSQPVTRAVWPWGRRPSAAGWRIGLQRKARELMRAEVEAQWRMFCKTGLRCAFFNSHHHLHTHPLVYREVLRALAGGFKGWLRLGWPMRFDRGPLRALSSRALALLGARRRRKCPFRTTRTLWGIDRSERINADESAAALPRWPRRARARRGAGAHEFMFHPRAIDDGRDTAALLRLRELLPELRPGGGAAAAAARKKW